MNTLTVTLRDVGGETMLDAAGMGLMFGVDPAEVENHLRPPSKKGVALPIPREWVKRGRQRAREAQAHTGATDWLSVLGYWADKDHGAQLEVIYQ